MPSTIQSEAGLWFLNAHVDIKVAGKDNADNLCVMVQTMPFGEAPPLHVHHDEDEVFHVQEGRVRFQVGDERMEAKPGDVLLAPRGVPHTFRVVSPEGAKILTISRGGFETMVRNASRPADYPSLPPAEVPTLEMQAALAAFCAAERIEFLGPSIA